MNASFPQMVESWTSIHHIWSMCYRIKYVPTASNEGKCILQSTAIPVCAQKLTTVNVIGLHGMLVTHICTHLTHTCTEDAQNTLGNVSRHRPGVCWPEHLMHSEHLSLRLWERLGTLPRPTVTIYRCCNQD